MKEFWSDYAKMCKQSGEFYKEHWKGIIILNVALAGAFAGYMAIATHKDEIKSSLRKRRMLKKLRPTRPLLFLILYGKELKLHGKSRT